MPVILSFFLYVNSVEHIALDICIAQGKKKHTKDMVFSMATSILCLDVKNFLNF